MNQNDWVEYFEAINGRKPSMQEFQEAREKGEFVVERKEAPTPTTEAPAQPLKRRLMLRKHLLHLAHLFHKSRQLLSNRNHRRKPCNLFQDQKN